MNLRSITFLLVFSLSSSAFANSVRTLNPEIYRGIYVLATKVLVKALAGEDSKFLKEIEEVPDISLHDEAGDLIDYSITVTESEHGDSAMYYAWLFKPGEERPFLMVRIDKVFTVYESGRYIFLKNNFVISGDIIASRRPMSKFGLSKLYYEATGLFSSGTPKLRIVDANTYREKYAEVIAALIETEHLGDAASKQILDIPDIKFVDENYALIDYSVTLTQTTGNTSQTVAWIFRPQDSYPFLMVKFKLIENDMEIVGYENIPADRAVNPVVISSAKPMSRFLDLKSIYKSSVAENAHRKSDIANRMLEAYGVKKCEDDLNKVLDPPAPTPPANVLPFRPKKKSSI